MDEGKIVVINDSDEFLDTTREILTEAGYAVATHRGAQLTADDIALEEPDLVILDLVLRGAGELTTGWDLLLLLRSHPRLASVPVIVCSADTVQLHKREQELQRVAATRVLAKPFTLEQLETTVRLALEDAAREAS